MSKPKTKNQPSGPAKGAEEAAMAQVAAPGTHGVPETPLPEKTPLVTGARAPAASVKSEADEVGTKKAKPILVRAVSPGFFECLRVPESKNAEFEIPGDVYADGPKKGQVVAFSSTWMERIDGK